MNVSGAHRIVEQLLLGFSILLMIGYPYLVHQTHGGLSTRLLSALLGALLLGRFLLSSGSDRGGMHWFLIVIAVFCLIVAIVDSAALLKFYPALMNATISTIFAMSWLCGRPIIAQFLKSAGKPPPPRAVSYISALTLAWALLLLINAAVAFYTACCTSQSFWAFYNSFLSYCLVLSFIAAEFIYRPFYKRRYERRLQTQSDHD